MANVELHLTDRQAGLLLDAVTHEIQLVQSRSYIQGQSKDVLNHLHNCAEQLEFLARVIEIQRVPALASRKAPRN